VLRQRTVRLTGTLRGFDQFMNLVLDDTEEQVGAWPPLAPPAA